MFICVLWQTKIGKSSWLLRTIIKKIYKTEIIKEIYKIKHILREIIKQIYRIEIINMLPKIKHIMGKNMLQTIIP